MTVGRRIVDQNLLESSSVISEDPAVPNTLVAMRSKSQIDNTVAQQKPWPLILTKGIKDYRTGSITGAWHACLYRDWPAKFLCARSDVKSVQSLHVVSTFLCLGDNIQGAGGGINDGRPSDSNLCGDVTAFAGVSAGNC